MGLKFLVALVALAPFIEAANYKRVACPDGVNTATNAAVGSFVWCRTDDRILTCLFQCCSFFALRDDLQQSLFEGQCGEDG